MGENRRKYSTGVWRIRVQHQVSFPAASIPEASKILVRLYPGPLSQVVEGMDAILRMPGGCFEQTSSSTYPNVLALDYMKRINKLTPEVHAKAEGYIGNGYQRLLTFEVPGGGFSWFGRAPANKILTSYGLMEFFDMSKVHDVDPRVIERTQQWLAGQQQAGWKLEAGHGFHQRRRDESLQLRRAANYGLHCVVAREYGVSRSGGREGAAVCRAAYGRGRWMRTRWRCWRISRRITERIASSRVRQCGCCSMRSRERRQGLVECGADRRIMRRGESASVETTGLAVQALLKWGGIRGRVRRR